MRLSLAHVRLGCCGFPEFRRCRNGAVVSSVPAHSESPSSVPTFVKPSTEIPTTTSLTIQWFGFFPGTGLFGIDSETFTGNKVVFDEISNSPLIYCRRHLNTW